MSRFVWPNAFMLYSCELVAELHNDRYIKMMLEVLPEVMKKSSRPGEASAPVVLRWSTRPDLGFPRQPFNLYRRPRIYAFESLLKDRLQVTTSATVDWGLREMYIVRFSAALATGKTLVVSALDRTYQPIPGQEITFTASRIGMFTSPGIAALLAVGEGVIFNVEGVDQANLANDGSWELIQVVGFPYKAGETAMPVYDTTPQGYVPPAMSGIDFARLRLKLAAMLHQPLPDTGMADYPTPAWPAPDPALYLDYLRNGVPSAFWLVDRCLSNTDEADPSRLQADYIETVNTQGIHQVDIPGATPGPDPTVMHLPAVGVIMLSASSDSDSASGLGYGTMDFPALIQIGDNKDILEPPGMVHTGWDYMVTNKFIFPFFGSFEVAALAQAQPMPQAPTTLTASTLQVNRAEVQDGAYTESVQLRWNLSVLPQAYGILVSHNPFASNVLNAARPTAGGYDPYLALRPASASGSPPAGVLTIFTDPVSPMPISGTLVSRYLVAGLDVFGRWSGWKLATHSVSAPPVIQPGLLSATLIPDPSLAVGRVVPGTLEIEFSWDWSDRSPDRVEFTGGFISSTASPIPVFGSGFALSPGGGAGSTVVISFSSSGTPSITSAHSGLVEVLTLNPPDPDRRRYRLTLTGLSCDYTSASKVAYAVYARGAEKLRPTELSVQVGPRRAEAPDPLPPQVPVLPVDIQWTALPDATGRARGVLTWPAATGAAGYVAWEATESALRAVVSPTTPEPAPTTTIVARAASLRSMITASAITQAASLQAFSRLNTDLLHSTSLELVLPAGASTIYAYRVSSVNDANVESERSSTIALFAVPHRNQPGQPRLVLRKTAPSTGFPAGKIQGIALPGVGAAVAGYRVYRVRSAALLADPGMKGPPKIDPGSSVWAPVSFQTLNGSEAGLAIEDPVAPSWYPYYYQIVALGVDNPTAGEYRGESIPSAVQPGFLPPVGPPALTLVSDTANTTNRVITFQTSLPIKASSLGVASLELVQVAMASDGRSIQRTTLLAVRVHEIPTGLPLTLLAVPSKAQLAAMPEITRGEPDSTGLVQITVRFKADTVHGAIAAHDPLSRTTLLDF